MASPLAIESNHLFAVAADLSLLEVFAKRVIAVPRFLILNLLPRQKIVDFLALPGSLDFLSSKLFRLFFLELLNCNPRAGTKPIKTPPS